LPKLIQSVVLKLKGHWRYRKILKISTN
jgi:hypothetical protein